MKNILRIVLLFTLLVFSTGCNPSNQTDGSQTSAPAAQASPQIRNEALPTATPAAPPTQQPEPESPAPAAEIRGRTFNGAALKTVTDRDGLQEMISAGSRWVRLDLNWAVIEPSEGVRRWEAVANLEKQFVNARESGMQVVLILGGTPAWAAQPNYFFCGGKVNPEKYQALAEFSRDMALRYLPEPFGITYYEFWNEPEVHGFLGCWGEPEDDYYGGEDYGRMLQAVYPVVKQAAPEAQILVGGLLLDCDPTIGVTNPDGSPKDCRPGRFFEGALKSGAGNSFDGVSFHAYDYYNAELGKYSNFNFGAYSDQQGSVTLAKAAYLRKLMREAGVEEKPLMNTEAALLCRGDTCMTPEFQATKAFLMVEEAIQAFADGYINNIWYSVYGDRNSAILRQGSLEPYPVYYAFQFINLFLDSAISAQRVELDPDLHSYEITRVEDSVYLLWNRTNSEKTFTLSTIPDELVRIGMDGKPVDEPVSDSVTVGPAPLFLIYKK